MSAGLLDKKDVTLTVRFRSPSLSKAEGSESEGSFEILRYAQNDKKQISIGISPAVGGRTEKVSVPHKENGLRINI
jgi:hypothetical protein